MQRQTSRSGCKPAKTGNLPQIPLSKPRHARGFVCVDLAKNKADPRSRLRAALRLDLLGSSLASKVRTPLASTMTRSYPYSRIGAELERGVAAELRCRTGGSADTTSYPTKTSPCGTRMRRCAANSAATCPHTSSTYPATPRRSLNEKAAPPPERRSAASSQECFIASMRHVSVPARVPSASCQSLR